MGGNIETRVDECCQDSETRGLEFASRLVGLGQTRGLDGGHEDIQGLTRHLEGVAAVDLEEVGAHEGEDGDAVLEDEVGVEHDTSGQNLEGRVTRVRVGTCADTEHKKFWINLEFELKQS